MLAYDSVRGVALRGDDDGKAELEMLKTIAAAGYTGPIGILGHREDRDVEECLREGLDEISRTVRDN